MARYPADKRRLSSREPNAVRQCVMASPGTFRTLTAVSRRMKARTGKYHSSGQVLRLLVRAWIKSDVRQMRKKGLDPVVAYSEAYRHRDLDDIRDVAAMVFCNSPRVFTGTSPPPE